MSRVRKLGKDRRNGRHPFASVPVQDIFTRCVGLRSSKRSDSAGQARYSAHHLRLQLQLGMVLDCAPSSRFLGDQGDQRGLELQLSPFS